MQNSETDFEKNPSESAEEEKRQIREKLIESMVRPFEQLLATDALKPLAKEYAPFMIYLEWDEPRQEEGQSVVWQKRSGWGPINESMVKWVEDHYDFWIDHAHVNLKIKKIFRAEEDKEKPAGERLWH
ncbi:hypothetical protein C4569_02225 [Candidatus Parcubacteria bacterium]|nr:MAG: hypothetical protein C4569_02225 [Candidatus Parcubacteria bacterium]